MWNHVTYYHCSEDLFCVDFVLLKETFSEYLENIFVKDMFPTDDEIIEPPQLGELLAFIAVLTVLIYFSVLSGYLVKPIIRSSTLCKPS